MGGTSAQEPVQRPQDSSNPTQLQGQAAGCEKGGGGGLVSWSGCSGGGTFGVQPQLFDGARAVDEVGYAVIDRVRKARDETPLVSNHWCHVNLKSAAVQ